LSPSLLSTLPEDNAGSANAFLFELAPSELKLAYKPGSVWSKP